MAVCRAVSRGELELLDAGRFRLERATIAARTLRTDRWWLPPLATFVAFVAWVAYATVRAFMQDYYYVARTVLFFVNRKFNDRRIAVVLRNGFVIKSVSVKAERLAK